MKAIAAIVEPAQIDVDLIAERIIVAIADHRGIETKISRLEGQLGDARGAARMRRIEIGRLLLKARRAWPERGPNAKGWGEFCAKVQLADSTARMYMDECRDPEAFADKRAKTSSDQDEPDPSDGPRVTPAPRESEPAPFRQLTEADLVQALGRLDPDARKRVLKTDKANVKGGSGETDRGMWCTSAKWAAAVGPWELDPFSNPRSRILSGKRCMLEDGGDAFGGETPGETIGRYRTGTSHGQASAIGVADYDARVWIQPPYELVAQAIAHFGHARFCALLRWSPDVKAWFPQLWQLTAVVCFPLGERMEFDPPPGVEKSGDMPFPHALYYADERDVTDEVRKLCIVWRVDHSLDPALPDPAALHIVR